MLVKVQIRAIIDKSITKLQYVQTSEGFFFINASSFVAASLIFIFLFFNHSTPNANY
jgi:hypothetical protein